MDRPVRKPNRIPGFQYSTPGAYFITICTKDRKCTLGKVVGGGALDAPQVQLSRLGKIVEAKLVSGNRIPNIHVDKYVIMPNHIHFILMVGEADPQEPPQETSPANALVPHFVSTLKRFCHKAAGGTLFQRSYHDHVIRNEADYRKIWEYIDGNPSKWEEDCFYEE